MNGSKLCHNFILLRYERKCKILQYPPPPDMQRIYMRQDFETNFFHQPPPGSKGKEDGGHAEPGVINQFAFFRYRIFFLKDFQLFFL